MADPIDRDEMFVGLMSSNQLRLRAHLTGMVRNQADVEDVMQETNLAIWRKREKYDPERPFAAWAMGIASIEVARLRRRSGKDKLIFSDELINLLTSDFIKQVDLQDARRDALGECLQKLTASDRQLVEDRFKVGKSISLLALELGRPEKTVYWLLSRIREQLYHCIQKFLKMQDHPRLSSGNHDGHQSTNT